MIILSLFFYGIEIWGSSLQKKYLNHIDKFFKRAHRFGYVLREYKMSELIETRDKTLFKQIIDNPDHILNELLPGKRQKNLRKHEHPFILQNIRTERFKHFFVNRCLFNYF